MTDRNIFGADYDGPFADDGLAEGYGGNIRRHLAALYNASVLRLVSVAGTDAITAGVDPELDPQAGLVAGMHFVLRPVATNTGAATLSIGGGAAVDIVGDDGAALGPGELEAGTDYLLAYDGADLRVLGRGGAAAGGAQVIDRQVFNASGSWVKPPDADPDREVVVRLWGGGGGGTAANNGNSGSGGQGAGYMEWRGRLGDLPSSVSVIVGAGGPGAVGGAAASNGGSSSFGALATAQGGLGAVNISSGGGGPSGGGLNGGAGADETTATPAGKGGDIWSGGGGASGFVPAAGGAAALGGGGGGARASSSVTRPPGLSALGGDGGAADNPGQVPGGGGGGGSSVSPGSPGGSGGAGRVIVIVL